MRAHVALAVIAAGAAAVLVLWWHSTRGIVGAGGVLTAAGEGLGLGYIQSSQSALDIGA